MKQDKRFHIKKNKRIAIIIGCIIAIFIGALIGFGIHNHYQAKSKVKTTTEQTISDDSKVNAFLQKAFAAKDAKKFLSKQAKLVETQILKIHANGMATYENKDGSGGSIYVDGLKVGETKILGANCPDDLKDVRLDVYTLNDDHTITYEIYTAK